MYSFEWYFIGGFEQLQMWERYTHVNSTSWRQSKQANVWVDMIWIWKNPDTELIRHFESYSQLAFYINL